MDPRLRLAGMILVLLIFPVAYVAAINAVLPYNSLAFETGWTDQSFSGWTVNASQGTNGSLAVSNGSLSVISATMVTPQQFVAADSPNLPLIDISRYHFLIVSIRAPAYYVAARIVIWAGGGGPIAVLVKTYADTGWHTEVIDLRFFGLSIARPLRMIELGWQGVETSASAGTHVEFRGLSLAKQMGEPG
jgi:hypothetical protein